MKQVIVARPTTSDVGLRTSGLSEDTMNSPLGAAAPYCEQGRHQLL